MIFKSFFLFLLFALLSASLIVDAEEIIAYPTVPGLAPSKHYKLRVRLTQADSTWKDVFAWETECKDNSLLKDKYYDHLAGWSHTYVNFENSGPVEIEIARVDDQKIKAAVVHPQVKASACVVKAGKAYIKLEQNCLIAVDIDGQMDQQDTGMGYKGPPIHTVSIFANPLIKDKPNLKDPQVLAVKPGVMPPVDGHWKTLYFLPGVHDLGLTFPVQAHRQYYIPGDAIVYGTFSNKEWGVAQDIRLFGVGTLSGARTRHPETVQPKVAEKNYGDYRPIELVGTTDAKVEGLTIADSAYHSIMLINPYKADHPNEITWTKIFTWRVNGDGINPFGNTRIEDCFIRTQDDSLYVNGLGIKRTVIWNDANGSAFVLSSLSDFTDRKLIVEDCDIIYSRAKWHKWSGGRVFNMRAESNQPGGQGVIFRNINIEDPRPTLQQFFICMTVPEPYSKNPPRCKPGDISGVLFQNISIAAASIVGEPQILWGQSDARIRNLTFENLKIAGKPVLDDSFFQVNEYVEGLNFSATPESQLKADK